MVVTVPAKDEAAFIIPCLQALESQRELDGGHLDHRLYAVLVLANNCTDDTAALARQFGRDNPGFQLYVVSREFPSPVGGVGPARKTMMDAAARRLPRRGIVAMTDADTQVDAYWIAATFRAFKRGARAVGGRILVPPTLRQAYRRVHLQDVTYRMLRSLLEAMIDPDPEDPRPRHFQHYGPSLAVSQEAYLACGGMPPLSSIEDAAFAWALERIDVDIVHDPAVRVYTSDRQSDRIAGVTFSASLEEWSRMERENRHPVVFGLQHCIELFKWKVALRRAYHERRIGNLPALSSLLRVLAMDPRELQRLIVAAPSFGELYVGIRHRIDRSPGYSDCTFAEAIAELRSFTRSVRECRVCERHPGGSVRVGFPEYDRSHAVPG